jgi:NADH-quinone oxidoreductase E subunit
MLMTEQERLRDEIRSLVDEYGRDRSVLIPILQAVQKKYKYINEFAQQQIADLLDIHPVEVYGVITFYSFLSHKPQGKFIIRLCQTISCDMQGKDKIATQLVNDLGIKFGETSPDGMFTLEWASCLGMCDQGPAMLVNDKVYTKVSAEQVASIIEECRKSAYYDLSRKEGTH